MSFDYTCDLPKSRRKIDDLLKKLAHMSNSHQKAVEKGLPKNEIGAYSLGIAIIETAIELALRDFKKQRIDQKAFNNLPENDRDLDTKPNPDELNKCWAEINSELLDSNFVKNTSN